MRYCKISNIILSLTFISCNTMPAQKNLVAHEKKKCKLVTLPMDGV